MHLHCRALVIELEFEIDDPSLRPILELFSKNLPNYRDYRNFNFKNGIHYIFPIDIQDTVLNILNPFLHNPNQMEIFNA